MTTDGRRGFLHVAASLGAGFLIGGCNSSNNASNRNSRKPETEEHKKDEEAEVTATEDLMREHGVLRRALLIYTAAASQLRSNPAAVPPDALQKTARFFRNFGEDYHERRLEEPFIFPTVKLKGGPAAAIADVLAAQHQRGREITDYILAKSAAGSKFSSANSAALAKSLDELVLMYQHHAAREDTIVFPAWKQTQTAEQLNEMNEKFEDIEHQQFGKDGYEDAVAQVTDIENTLGISDLAKLTAPPPPEK